MAEFEGIDRQPAWSSRQAFPGFLDVPGKEGEPECFTAATFLSTRAPMSDIDDLSKP
jgi:hypothetical protein